MLFFVRHQDTEHTVRVENRLGKLYIKYDAEPEEEANLSFYGNDVTYVHERTVLNANVVGNKNGYVVWRPEGNLEFKVESEYRRIVSMLRGQALNDESNVYAKMPGKITKILAKVGDEVEPGKSVVVMEAMKMENEVRAAISGIITQIHIKEGQAVETGALLMEIKLADEV